MGCKDNNKQTRTIINTINVYVSIYIYIHIYINQYENIIKIPVYIFKLK